MPWCTRIGKKLQSDLVASFCENEKNFTWVADADGIPAGLIVFKFNEDEKTGEKLNF